MLESPFPASISLRIIITILLRLFGATSATSLLDEQAAVSLSQSPSCRCFPGDTCWPSAAEWRQFNTSVGGRLIKTAPLGASCHHDKFAAYDAEECKELQEEWIWPQVHYESSSSIMAPFFANRSCDPYLPTSARCIIGTYVRYSVNISSVSDIVETIRFVTKKNIRLVIRNTGHDYNGKSTGAGAVAIWTHFLKSKSIIPNFASPHYSGPAMRMGAGVQALEAYTFAAQHGFDVVGGECATVGLAGGYTQGGGHSALASRYGLGADQVLEWEVVDGTGKTYTANRQQNTDLFWALSGGGGGTYGVVTAMTVKAHPQVKVSGANLTFSAAGISQDTYYEAITTFHTGLADIVDQGAMAIFFYTNESFTLSPVTAPGISAKMLKKLLNPFETALKNLGIKYEMVVRQFDTYLEQYNAMQWPIQVGVAQYGGRLISRDVVLKNGKELTEAIRYINAHGGSFTGVGLNVSMAVAGDVHNAVLPAWRDTLIDAVLITPWNFTAPLSEMLARQRLMTDEFIPRLEKLTPGSGCYLNEGDFLQPNWQQVFYGANYNKLLNIKEKYDPLHLFWATTAVGSEFWTVQGDGRLCESGS